MEPVRRLSREDLLDALARYYDRCHEISRTIGSDDEYFGCRLKVDSILKELDNRRITGSPADRVDPSSENGRRSSG
jgi:hypothetical protein